LFSNATTVAFEDEFFADGFIFSREGDKDCADGFSGCCAGWAGNPGYADPQVSLGEFSDILRHEERGFLGNRAFFAYN